MLFQCQIRLLDHGLVSEAEHLRTVYHGMITEITAGALAPVIGKMEDYTNKYINGMQYQQSQHSFWEHTQLHYGLIIF